MPGPRSNIDVEVVRIDEKRSADVLMLKHGKSQHGIVIASVFAAKSWMIDGDIPPTGILERFLPPLSRQ